MLNGSQAAGEFNERHQQSVNSDGRQPVSAKKGQDDQKMKKYLIKIFEKMQESGSCLANGPRGESPDLLLEHSNSVQEQTSTLKKGADQSLTDIASHFAAATKAGPATRNATNGRKLQFYTSNNFYPGQPGRPGKQP